MSKILTKIIGACLGLSLASGVGVGMAMGSNNSFSKADAAETIAYTLDGTVTGGTNGYASESSITQNSISWGVYGNTTQSPWRIGGNSITNQNREIYTKEKLSSYNITKVTIDVGSASNITVNSLTLKVGTSQKGSQTSTVTGTFSANSTITFTKPNNADWSNKYFDIVFNVTVSGTTNRFVQFKNAKFYKDSSEASLTSVEITGSLTKTAYTFGEGWSRTGLSLLGHYDNNTSKTITSGVTWSYNPGCAKMGVTSLTVTATIEGLSASYTTDITVSKIASPFVNGVPYKMYLHNTSKNADYYFIGSMDGHYGATTDDSTSSDIVNVYFEPNSDGQSLYFYAGNDTTTTKQYINIVTSGTYINFNYGSTSAVFYYNGKSMVTYVSSVDGIYGLGTYGSYVTFGATASYQSSDYFAQFELVNPLTAEDFATQLLDIITCDSTGDTAPTYKYNYSWQALNDLYDQLDSSEQLILKNANITDSGTIAEAMARYNYIVGKYSYTNFIGRTISSSANKMVNLQENSDMMVVIIIISFLAVSGVCAFMLIRKKKGN